MFVMQTRIPHHSDVHPRRGLLTPAIAVALLVVMAATALVLDRLWLESARIEMTTAAEASALAAGKQLATEESLRANDDGLRDLESARQLAAEIAAQNLVAGQPVSLADPATGDIRFGQSVWNRDLAVRRFVETEYRPTSVVVTLRRTRAGDNPVALFVSGLTGQPAGDVTVRVEATIDNRVRGVRPFPGARVPAVPLAILEQDPTGNRSDTWEAAIEQRGGQDQYRCNPETGQITAEPDGIPELILRTGIDADSSTAPNARLVDLGTSFQSDRLESQIRHGWTAEHLAAFGGELAFDGVPILLPARTESSESICAGFDALIGQARICLLYTAGESAGTGAAGQISCDRLVAIRVLDVRWTSHNSCEVIVQPGVVTTRTAMLTGDGPDFEQISSAGRTERNRYIYKLHLSR